MPNKNQTGTSNGFVLRVLPWLLGGALLLVYLLTLNRWITLANIMPVAKVSGFLWQPELFNPLMVLFTSPFRLLPAGVIPLALNLFSAVCAALSLVLLARCVAILPQDRTEAQRLRERSAFACLTTRSAWFPPLLAVLMLGVQFGFWKSATNFTGESLDLLIFAAVIWLLLEYRLDERSGRLSLAALIYGAGITQNWAMLGFLPVFIIALIWLKGLEFFSLRFLGRTFFCALVGLLFYLVLPAVAKFSSGASLGFWELLKPALQTDWQVIKAVSSASVRHSLLLMSMTTFLPLLVMSIRWSGSFGDTSHTGKLLATQMFHIIHAVFFGVCLWIMFDPPFSPAKQAMGFSGLTFYYLSALAIGYYSGYFILVFGKKAVPSRRDPRPPSALPKPLKPLTPVIYGGTYGVAFILLIALAYQNFSVVRAYNDDTLSRYAKAAVQLLPKKGAILLSDNDSFISPPQTSKLLIQAELARLGRAKNYLVVDTDSLNWAPYFHYLHEQAPDKWPEIPGDQRMAKVRKIAILKILDELSKTNRIYYLNPSYGYYFELFYQEPHGLVYRMRKLPAKTLIPEPLSTNAIAENQTFWKRIVSEDFPRLETVVKSSNAMKKTSPANPLNWLVRHLHGQSHPNPNALYVANIYSRALDYWGVELQRANRLKAAANCFANARVVNPDNVVAGINLAFNQTLQSNAPVKVEPQTVNFDRFGKYRNWNAVLSACGPFDDPSFLFVNSVLMARSGLIRQTVAPFHRVCQVAPDYLPAKIWLAQMYLYNRLPDHALATLKAPLTHPAKFGLNGTNSVSVNMLAAYSYFQKNELRRGAKVMNLEIARHPDNTNLLTAVTRAFLARGLYTNALHAINRGLALAPNSPQWLFGKGIASLQMSNYDASISAMTRVLQLTTNDPNARFNRAIAYLKSGQLSKARADYKELQNTYTNSFQVAYGLGEIAWRQHDTNEALRNYAIYLAHAPTNSAEYKTVRLRAAQLQKK